MRPDIVPGAIFPDYRLPDHRGKQRTLSELQGGDPMGCLCSPAGASVRRTRRQHEGLLQRHGHRARMQGWLLVRLVTHLDRHPARDERVPRAGVGAGWPFLSDAGRTVQKDLDIAEYTDPPSQPDDSAHAWCSSPGCASTRSTTATGILRPADGGGAAPRSARGAGSAAVPTGTSGSAEQRAAWAKGRIKGGILPDTGGTAGGQDAGRPGLTRPWT